jgi:hypothetical protein
MEYRIVQLKAEIATGRVIEAHWNVTLTEAPYSVYRYGSVGVPSDPAPLVYAGLDESTAIEAVKDILGPEYIEALEAGMVAEMAALQNPTTISGLPWAPPAPPPAPAPAP